MPRTPKSRTILDFPDYWSFSPDEGVCGDVTLTLDEFEVIRQIDQEGKTQEETADIMKVARTTVTSIYTSARKKLADALIHGKKLQISGGSYQFNNSEFILSIEDLKKGAKRIAIPYKDGKIQEHFGLTDWFKFYDILDGKIINEQILYTGGPKCGSLARYLKAAKTSVLLCDVIGYNAQRSVLEAKIELYSNLKGDTDIAIRNYISNEGKAET